MLSQQVAPEVAFEIAPDGVDVVSSVLGAIVLEEKLGCLDAPGKGRPIFLICNFLGGIY